MNHKTSLGQRLGLSWIFAVAAALGINAVIGLAMVHSPDGVRMMALHATTAPHHMVANLGATSPIQVCAKRLPA